MTRRMLQFLTAGLLTFAVAGCAVGPDYVRPETSLTEDWSLAEAEPLVEAIPDPTVGWWEVFGDPVLNQLIEDSYAQNLDLEIAGLRIVEARAALAIALGSRWPQDQALNGSALRTGVSANSPNFFPFADDTFWNVGLGFDATWELDFWGRFRSGIEAAQFDFASSIADYDATIVSITAETARAYLVVRALQELLTVTLENVELQQRSFEIADVLARNGRVTELDVQQAITLLESTRAQVPLLEAQLIQALNALSFLLGESPGQIEARLGTGDIPSPPGQVVVGVPAELLRRRPDVRTAEFQAAAQTAIVGLAEAERYPRFGLTGSIGLRTSDTGSNELGDLFSSDSVEFIAGPIFSWPILNYGRIRNAVRVEDARLQQLLVNYQRTVLDAAREAEDAMAAFLRENEALESYLASTQAARRSVDLSLLEYREGITDYQRVLDTQRSLNAQQRLYVQSKGELATHLVALYKALGGGWELRASGPIVDEATILQMQDRTNWGDLLEVETAEGREPFDSGDENQ